MLASGPLIPSGQGSLVTAAQFIADLLTGSVATAFATIAVAGLGFGMLRGIISATSAARVLVGCFILFGAPYITRAIIAPVEDVRSAPPAQVYAAPVRAAPVVTNASNAFDPYAGASVPSR